MVNAQRLRGPLVLQDFETTIQNAAQSTTNPLRLEFEVYLLDTDPSQEFILATYQAGIYINPGIFAPGAIVTVSIVAGSSTLVSAQIPNSIQYDPAANVIKLGGRVPPGPGFPGAPAGTVISSAGMGTRICRIRVATDAGHPFVTNSTPNLEFFSSDVLAPLYATRVAYYDYTNAIWDDDLGQWAPAPINTQLDVIPGLPGVPGTNAHVYPPNPILNPGATCADPMAFNVTGSGSYCEGSGGLAVGLDGSQVGVNYTLMPGDIVVPGTGAAITFTPNQLAGTYTVTGTGDGTVPTICTTTVPMTGSAIIVEDPALPVSLIIAANQNNVCAGTIVEFLATPVNPGTTPVYQWFVNGVVQAATGLTFSYAPMNLDEVYATLLSDAPCATGNPATSNTIVMAVNPVLFPEVTVVADPAGAVTTGTLVTFTAMPLNGGAGPTYEWYVNDIMVSTANPYAYIPLNGDEVYVVMTSNAICADPLIAVSDLITMIVVDVVLPPVAFDVTGGGEYCAGEPGVAVGLSDSEMGVTYTLYKDGIAQAMTYPGTGNPLDFGLWTAGVYTVSGTNGGGTTPMNGSAVVIENPLPIATITAGGPTSFCDGGSVELTASAGDNWLWSTGEFTQTIVVTVSGMYTVTVTTNGCSATSLPTEVIVTPNVTPSVTIVASANNVVEGTMVTFTATPVNGGIPSYLWFVNGVPAGADYFEFAYIPMNGDVVYVQMTSSLTCVTQPTAMSDPITMIVVPAACPATTWTGLVDNDWFNPGNWVPCVPQAATMVMIPAGAPNYPTLLMPAACADITIASGASFIGSEFLMVGNAHVLQNFPVPGYHYISSSVQATTFDDVFPLNQSEVWAYLYNEPTGNWMNQLYSDPMLVGTGYSVLMNTPQTAMFEGQLNNNTVSMILSAMNTSGDADRVGWNLLGNPFTSAILWDQVIRGTSVDGAVYVWNGFNYISYAGGPGGLVGGIIPAHNGFFTKTLIHGDFVTIPLGARVHSNIPFYKESFTNLLSMRVDGNTYFDEAFIHFNESATAGFDSQYDAYKLMGIDQAPQLYSMISGDILNINALSMEGNEVVNLGFKCGIEGSYTVTASGMESFSSTTPILLEDLKLNTIQDLRLNPVYNFNYTTNDNENRFKLHFKNATGIYNPELNGIAVYSFDHTVVINNTTTLTGEVQIFDLTGRELRDANMKSSTTTRIPMQAAIGTYIVKVTTAQGSVNQKVFIK